MKKLEFKKLYSHYRKTVNNFRAKLESSNYPCGYDDSLCDNFEYQTKKFLTSNPVIKTILNVTRKNGFISYRFQLCLDPLH